MAVNCKITWLQQHNVNNVTRANCDAFVSKVTTIFKGDVIMFTGAPLADYLAAKRVGNMLYMSSVIAVDPTVRKVVTSYDDLPNEARKQLHTRGYNARQMSVDIFETLASVQNWFVLNRI